MKCPIIEASGCRVRLSGRDVLHNIDWTLRFGEHQAVLGGNGAGKTTFLRLIAGLQQVAQDPGARPAGRIVWRFNADASSSPLAARRNVRFVGADAADAIMRLPGCPTTLDIVLGDYSGAVYAYTTPKPEQTGAALAALDRVGLSDQSEVAFRELSRGRMLRALLARALVGKPAVLILDEALNSLDESGLHRVFDIVDVLSQESTILFGTHRPDRLPSFLQKAVLLRNGRIVADGDMTVVSEAMRSFSVEQPTPAGFFAMKKRCEVVLDMKNTNIFRNGRQILYSADWLVRGGEHWLVKGANGAGKSTLLAAAAARLRPFAGGCIQWFDGAAPGDIRLLRRLIGFAAPEMQAEYEYDPYGLEFVVSGFFASVGLYERPGAKQLDKARALMEAFGVSDAQNKRYRSQSYGRQRRLLLARALVADPPLLILDEADGGLDEGGRRLLGEMMTAAAACGTTILAACHQPAEQPPLFNRSLRVMQGVVVVDEPSDPIAIN